MKLNIAEALRFLGAGDAPPEPLRQQAEEVARTLTAALSPRHVWRIFPLEFAEGRILLPGSGVVLTGNTGNTMLSQCSQAAILCCTLGADFEALLRRTQARDMAKAALLDACGSAYVEAGCDLAQEEIAARFPRLYLTDRFSPGYGDLPLTCQEGICAALDTQRRLGVEVTKSLLLNPGKSVTAIIGLSDRPQMARVRGCAYCTMNQHCTLRKGGTTCGI